MEPDPGSWGGAPCQCIERGSVSSRGEAFSQKGKRFLERGTVLLSRKRFSSRENASPLVKTLLLSRKRFPSRENDSPFEKTLCLHVVFDIFQSTNTLEEQLSAFPSPAAAAPQRRCLPGSVCNPAPDPGGGLSGEPPLGGRGGGCPAWEPLRKTFTLT